MSNLEAGLEEFLINSQWRRPHEKSEGGVINAKIVTIGDKREALSIY